jgi:YD repeat-containing protein
MTSLGQHLVPLGFPACDIRTTYVRDAVDGLLQRRYPDGTRHTFAYDEVGNRTLMADSTGRYSSTWDALDRRGSVNWPNKGRITYTWDAVGNRIGMVDPDGEGTRHRGATPGPCGDLFVGEEL